MTRENPNFRPAQRAPASMLLGPDIKAVRHDRRLSGANVENAYTEDPMGVFKVSWTTCFYRPVGAQKKRRGAQFDLHSIAHSGPIRSLNPI